MYPLRPQFLRLASFLALFGASCAAVRAHVAVDPTEAAASATITFNFRVPSEGGRTTRSVELSVPAGISVTALAVPEGGSASFERGADGQPDKVVWTITVPAGESGRVALTASGPAAAGRTIWRIKQHYTNGDIVDWTPTTTFR
jgi:uncharacterized protein YcnI